MTLEVAEVAVFLVAGPAELEDPKVRQVRPARQDMHARGLVVRAAEEKSPHQPGLRGGDEGLGAIISELVDGRLGEDAADEVERLGTGEIDLSPSHRAAGGNQVGPSAH